MADPVPDAPRPLSDAERDELDRLLAYVLLPTFTEREREIARRAARAGWEHGYAERALHDAITPDAPRAQAREIPRYWIGDGEQVMVPAPDGPWVLYADHESATAVLRDAHARLTAERDGARAELAKWKDAIIDAAVVNWTYQKAREDDPRAAVHALLCQAQLEALDPAISETAAKLKAEGAREALDKMTALMQKQPDGRYLDAAETWNALLAWLRTRAQEGR